MRRATSAAPTPDLSYRFASGENVSRMGSLGSLSLYSPTASRPPSSPLVADRCRLENPNRGCELLELVRIAEVVVDRLDGDRRNSPVSVDGTPQPLSVGPAV